MSLFWVQFFKPFVALIVVALITAPIAALVRARMKEGRLKAILLIDSNKQPRLWAKCWLGVVVVLYGLMALYAALVH